jgi:hypothetical protein
MQKVDFLIDCLLPLPHSPRAFIQTWLNRLLFLYNSYFQMTSRLQKLLSLSPTQLGLYLNLIPSTTRIHMISLLNRTCIIVLAWCCRVYIGVLPEAKKISLAYPMPYFATLPEFLPTCLPESYPSALPDRVTLTRPYPISLPGRVTPYPLCPAIFYPSR